MKKLLPSSAAILFFTIAATAQSNTLTQSQADAFQKIKVDTETRAAPYALKLAATIKKIYANMLSPHEDQRLRRRLNAQLHAYAGRLLDIKGESFRRSLHVLTVEQKRQLSDAMQKPDAPQDMSELIEKTFAKP